MVCLKKTFLFLLFLTQLLILPACGKEDLQATHSSHNPYLNPQLLEFSFPENEFIALEPEPMSLGLSDDANVTITHTINPTQGTAPYEMTLFRVIKNNNLVLPPTFLSWEDLTVITDINTPQYGAYLITFKITDSHGKVAYWSTEMNFSPIE